MTKMNVVYATFASLLLIGNATYAADLVNTDDVAYVVYVDTDDESETKQIAPNGTITEICTDCYIELDGNPKGVNVKEGEKVVIKEGNLIVEK